MQKGFVDPAAEHGKEMNRVQKFLQDEPILCSFDGHQARLPHTPAPVMSHQICHCFCRIIMFVCCCVPGRPMYAQCSISVQL